MNFAQAVLRHYQEHDRSSADNRIDRSAIAAFVAAAIFAARGAERGVNGKELSELLGGSSATWSRHLRHAEQFSDLLRGRRVAIKPAGSILGYFPNEDVLTEEPKDSDPPRPKFFRGDRFEFYGFHKEASRIIELLSISVDGDVSFHLSVIGHEEQFEDPTPSTRIFSVDYSTMLRLIEDGIWRRVE